MPKESLGERLNNLIELISVHPETKSTKPTIKDEQRALIREVEQCFDYLGKLGEFLPQAGFTDGVIELSTNKDQIVWGNMSKRLEQAFKPEFTFQPEEITSFTISCSGKIESNGERHINIDLERNNEPWSYVHAGAILRENCTAPTLDVGSQAPNAQVRAARLGLEALEAMPVAKIEEGELSHLLNRQQDLSVLKDAISFAIAELESKMPTAK